MGMEHRRVPEPLASHRTQSQLGRRHRECIVKRRAYLTPGNPRRGPGFYLAGPLERFALPYGQDRGEPYEPHGACLVEFGDGIS
jgi:hypothetical protein